MIMLGKQILARTGMWPSPAARSISMRSPTRRRASHPPSAPT